VLLLDDVAFQVTVVEEQGVAEACAAAGLHGHAQRDLGRVGLVGQETAHLLRGGLGQRDGAIDGGVSAHELLLTSLSGRCRPHDGRHQAGHECTDDR
jgi:hypothetical protein